MLITDTLKADHRLIIKYINLMEKYAEYDIKCSTGAEDSMLMAGAVSFFQFIDEFAVTYHHAKEAVFYKYMEEPGVLINRNPLPMVFSDHVKASERLTDIKGAFHSNNVAELIAAVERYVVLSMTHMFKEDNILHAMAEDRIADNRKAEMLKEFEEIDRQLDIGSILEKYNNLFFELQIYYDKKYRQLTKQSTENINWRIFPVNSRIGRRLEMA